MVIVVGLLALVVGGVAGWLARSRFGGSVDGQVAPVAQALGRLDAQVREMEQHRAEAYGGLTEQVRAMRQTGESLRSETGRLVTALRTPQTRGRWGEMQLRRVVEAAGAVEHCHFSEQVTLDDGRHRPDLVVDLADGKQLAVDAKVPLLHWLAAMEAPDEAALASARAAHARALRSHVKALGDKHYWANLEHSPEIVVLFLPADAFLDAALAEDPTCSTTPSPAAWCRRRRRPSSRCCARWRSGGAPSGCRRTRPRSASSDASSTSGWAR